MVLAPFSDTTYRLCAPSGLHDGSLARVLVQGVYVVAEAEGETGDGEEPEDETEGPGHAQLDVSGLGL